jgi:Zn-dependent M28 family amino/carboxypeptidase
MDTIKEILNDISVLNIEKHIRKLEGIRHPITGPAALGNAEAYIWNTLASYDHEMKAHVFEEDGNQYRNVIAVQEGTQQPAKIIICLAHFDTVPISPGADDNASGVAAVLELARVLKKHTFQKSIYFVGVNLEESKDSYTENSVFLRGSRALAAYARNEDWDIQGVFNFETIAYAGDDIVQSGPPNVPIAFPDQGNFITIASNENSTELVNAYAESIECYQIPLPYLPVVVPGNGEILPDSRRSDHAAFWDQGYPAVMITDTANFRNPHYHKSGDTFETINTQFTTEVCRAGGAAVCALAGLVSS